MKRLATYVLAAVWISTWAAGANTELSAVQPSSLGEGNGLAAEIQALGESAPFPIQQFEAELTRAGSVEAIGRIYVEREVGVLPFYQRVTFIPYEDSSERLIVWDTSPDTDSGDDSITANDEDWRGSSCTILASSSDETDWSLGIRETPQQSCQYWRITIPRNFLHQATPVQIDLLRICRQLGVPDSQCGIAVITQQHMDPLNPEYMTEHDAFVSVSGSTASVELSQAGRYMFSVRVGEKHEDVVCWGYRNAQPDKHLWVFMQDIWNNSGNPWDPSFPKDTPFFTDDEIEEKLAFLHDHGIVNIGFAQNVRFSGLDPVGFEKWNHSIPEDDLEWLLQLLKTPPGARVFVQLQTIVDPNWGILASDLRNYARLEEDLDEYFSEWSKEVRELGAVLESFDVDYFSFHNTPPLIWINEMADPLRGQVIAHWIDLLTEIGMGGAVGLTDFIMGAGLGGWIERQLLAAADFYLILVFNNVFCDSVDCDVDEVINHMSQLLQEISAYSGMNDSIESFFTFNPRSNTQALLGQMPPESGGRYIASTNLDYRAQVRALEGSLVAFLENQSMNNAMVAPEYWRMLDYERFVPRNWLERQIQIDTSLQGKPGFEVFELYNVIFNHPEQLVSPEVRVDYLGEGAQ